jgi:hypothetical protein
MRHRLSVIVFLLSFIVLITSIAHAQVDGVPVCTKPTNQTVPGIVPDGAGGAIIVWYDLRNGPAAGRPYVQRLNAAGAAQWGTDGIPVSDIGGQYSGADIVSDGAGGAILAWLQGTDVYMQRLNASGTRLWPTIDPNRNGVIVSSGRAAEDASITLDSTGGAIVAWRESSPTLGDYNIYAQRVSSDGIIQWDILHITVVTAPNDQYGAQLVSDGAGGAIMTWVDERSGFDIYMERLNSTGTILEIRPPSSQMVPEARSSPGSLTRPISTSLLSA